MADVPDEQAARRIERRAAASAQPSTSPVTDAMVERAWAAIVGRDIAPQCFNASIIRGDLRTALEAVIGPAQTGQQPVGWFYRNDYHGYQQVAKEFEGEEGQIPLYADAAQAPGARDDFSYRWAVETVLAKFRKDEADGFRSRDRQYAIDILGKAVEQNAADRPVWTDDILIRQLREMATEFSIENNTDCKQHICWKAAERIHCIAPALGSNTELPQKTGVVHKLKTWPEYFNEVLSGRKPFEWRVDDRDFKLGDTLVLQEYIPHPENPGREGKYTGREITKTISYIFSPWATNKRTVVMALADVASPVPSASRVAQPATREALEEINALISNGDRPTVNERNAFEHFTALNRLLLNIRDIARRALSSVPSTDKAWDDRRVDETGPEYEARIGKLVTGRPVTSKDQP